MLYVPREVRRFCENAIYGQPGATLGGLYIEIVSKWAYSNGLECSHSRRKIWSPPPNKTWRCQDCGAILKEGAKRMDGSVSLGLPEFHIVGFAEGRLKTTRRPEA